VSAEVEAAGIAVKGEPLPWRLAKGFEDVVERGAKSARFNAS
jgi:hypothetical protein